MPATIRIDLLLLLMTAGCHVTGHRSDAGALPSEAERATCNRIVLVEVSSDGKPFRAVVTGDEGVHPLVGLAAGSEFVFESWRLDNGQFAVGILLLPFFLVGGLIYAAAASPTAAERAEVERIRGALEAGYRASNTRAKLTQRFESAAWTSAGVDVHWQAAPPLRGDGRIDMAAMATGGVDTVVELELVAVRAHARSADEAFGFEVEVQATMIHTTDGSPFCRRTLVYRDPSRERTGKDWAAARGVAVSRELDRAVGLLAAQLAEDLFAHYRLDGTVGS